MSSDVFIVMLSIGLTHIHVREAIEGATTLTASKNEMNLLNDANPSPPGISNLNKTEEMQSC